MACFIISDKLVGIRITDFIISDKLVGIRITDFIISDKLVGIRITDFIISDKLVGIRITEEFLTLSAHIDKDEDRPWTMLYSENYFNEIFTKDMAARLTSIWDGISGKIKYSALLSLLENFLAVNIALIY